MHFLFINLFMELFHSILIIKMKIMAYLCILFLFLFSALLHSCQSGFDETDSSMQSGSSAIPTSTSFVLSQAPDSHSQGGYTEVVEKLDVMIFYKKGGDYVYGNRQQPVSLKEETDRLIARFDNLQDNLPEGATPADCRLFFVANGDRLNYNNLLQPGATTFARFGNALFGREDEPGNGRRIMTATAVMPLQNASAEPVSVALKRRVARIDFVCSLPGFVMNKAVLENVSAKTTLLETDNPAWVSYPPKEALIVDLAKQTAASAFPFPTDNKENKVKLHLMGTLNGKPVAANTLFEGASGPVDIVANTVYKVNVSAPRTRSTQEKQIINLIISKQ